MSGGWVWSTRSARLPKDWPERRFKVRLRSGGRCEQYTDGVRCPELGAECDHIERGDDHDLANLQWLCKPHHAAKTSREGNAAPRLSRHRPPEEHPAFR